MHQKWQEVENQTRNVRNRNLIRQKQFRVVVEDGSCQHHNDGGLPDEENAIELADTCDLLGWVSDVVDIFAPIRPRARRRRIVFYSSAERL